MLLVTFFPAQAAAEWSQPPAGSRPLASGDNDVRSVATVQELFDGFAAELPALLRGWMSAAADRPGVVFEELVRAADRKPGVEPHLEPDLPPASSRDLEPHPGPDRGPGVESEAEPDVVFVAADGEHVDAARLRTFLEGRGSVLAGFVDELVAAGVRYDVDPRVVVGIAGVESSFGERLPSGSHNAWGWSGSGPHGLKVWASWPEAIDDFTQRLGRLYDTDNVDAAFASTYCPPNATKWLETVTWVIGAI